MNPNDHSQRQLQDQRDNAPTNIALTQDLTVPSTAAGVIRQLLQRVERLEGEIERLKLREGMRS